MKIFTIVFMAFLLTACNNTQKNGEEESPILNAINEVSFEETLKDGDQINLPSDIDGVSIDWSSDKLGIINLEGEVSLPNTEIQTVTLTAVFELDGETETRAYVIDVHPSASTIINDVKSQLSLPRRIIIDLGYDLETERDGVTIEWLSSHPEYLDGFGNVTLPNMGEEVEVTLTATLSMDGVSDTHEISTIVTHYEPLHTYDPVDLIRPVDAPIHEGTVEGEIPPPENSPCFPGAWYNKAVSSKDSWLGIEGIITIPEVNLWDGRFVVDEGRYLDNPSIYLGGNGGAESDVGLSWMPVCNNAYCLSPGNDRVAFRPFWRYIDGPENIWDNSNYQDPQYYYFPGDTLRMTVFSPEPGYIQMEIEVINVTDIPEYVELRASFRIEDNMPSNFVSPKMPSVGHGGDNVEFKRVNAIDQVGNEGGPARPTESEINAGIWHEVFLYREIDGELKRVPFTRDRFDSMLCPVSDGFVLDYDHELVDESMGGEAIWIQPKRAEDYDPE